MKCKHARKMLIDYVNGSLEIGESRKLQEHVSGCHSCQSELEVMEGVLEFASNAEVKYPPEYVWDNFLTDLHKRIESEAALTFKKDQRQRFYFLPGWTASVATVVLVILTSVFLTYHPSSSSIRLHESRKLEIATYKPSSAVKYISEHILVADIISDVLITETEMVELKKLENFSRPEGLYYYYDDALGDVLVELDNIKDNDGLIHSLLNSELAEFEDSQMIDSSIDDYSPM